jgi:hypothetical protein
MASSSLPLWISAVWIASLWSDGPPPSVAEVLHAAEVRQ